jgi:branched-chain amino acid transport system permease protein
MTYFLQQLLNGISWGSILAMLGAGYTMTFGIIGLVNFAHGEVFMAGAFAAYFAIYAAGLPFGLAAPIGILGAIAVGLFVERVAFKPVRGSGMITLFITSFAASIGIRTLFVMLFTDKAKPFILPELLEGAYIIGDLFLFKRTIAIVVSLVVIGGLLMYLVKKTKTGVAMRAMSYDMETAQSMGMNTEKIIILTFIIASALAGVAAIMWGVSYGRIRSSMGMMPVVDAFIASVIGGVGNVFGAIVGGLILGIGETLFVAYLPPEMIGLRTLFVWIVLFVIIIVKPSGLFRANIK